MADILDRYVVEEWSGDGRSEVQASFNSNTEQYEVRLCGYQSNGRFAQYPPHFNTDPEVLERAHEGIEEMAEVARQANAMNDLGEIKDLVDELGLERARELLESERDRTDDTEAEPAAD